MGALNGQVFPVSSGERGYEGIFLISCPGRWPA